MTTLKELLSEKLPTHSKHNPLSPWKLSVNWSNAPGATLQDRSVAKTGRVVAPGGAEGAEDDEGLVNVSAMESKAPQPLCCATRRRRLLSYLCDCRCLKWER